MYDRLLTVTDNNTYPANMVTEDMRTSKGLLRGGRCMMAPDGVVDMFRRDCTRQGVLRPGFNLDGIDLTATDIALGADADRSPDDDINRFTARLFLKAAITYVFFYIFLLHYNLEEIKDHESS